jgi:serine/threonine protein kinase
MSNLQILFYDTYVIKRYLCDGNTQFKRAIRELTFLTSLDHPHICKLLKWEYYLNTAGICIIDLYLPRGTDIDYQKIDIFIVAEAIISAQAYMHENGVAHHDMKPENLIFLDNRIQVIDFDIAEQCNAFLQAPGTISGYAFFETPGTTVGYADPEYLPDEINSIKQDLYATAVTLYTIFMKVSPIAVVQTLGAEHLEGRQARRAGSDLGGAQTTSLYEMKTNNDKLNLLIIDLIAPIEKRLSAIGILQEYFPRSLSLNRKMPVPLKNNNVMSDILHLFCEKSTAEELFLSLYLMRCISDKTKDDLIGCTSLASIMCDKTPLDHVKTLSTLRKLNGLCWSTTPWNYARSSAELPVLLKQLSSPDFDMRKIVKIDDVKGDDKRISVKELFSLPLIDSESINSSEELVLILNEEVIDVESYITENDENLLLALALRLKREDIVNIALKDTKDISVRKRLTS